MKKRIVLLTLVSVFLLSAMVMTSAVAQERIVGVTVGGWFKYSDITVSWSSNDPWYPTFPPVGREYLKEMNETEWILMSIQNISWGKWVFLEIVKHFKDGTEKTENGSVDIETGTGIMNYRIISADLNANDTIYTGSPFSNWKIDETIVRTYPDGERETNHLNMTRKTEIIRHMDDSTINGTLYEFINYYWDKATGILVEQSYEEIEQVGEYQTTLSMTYRITESNVWTVPEFPTWTSMLLILIVLTVAIATYKWRLLKTSIR
jgi:hypothetical protein